MDNGHLIRLIDQGLSASQIAGRLKCKSQLIRDRAKKLPDNAYRKLVSNGRLRTKANPQLFQLLSRMEIDMTESHGITETKEMIDALMELSVCLIGVFRDGVQLSDAMELWEKIGSDPAMKAKFAKAFDGYQKIPAEIRDLNASEGVQLATCLMTYIPKILDSLKK